MKTHALKTTVLSFITASALMSPIVVGAKDANPAANAAPTASAGKSVSGKVGDKGANSLTIDGTKYMVSDSTTFTKGGLPIKIDDVKVGDQVRVTLADENGTQATAIEVEAGTK